MQEFEMGHNTVLHAIRVLAEEGFVVPIQSMGTFVRPREDWPAEEEDPK
jgi:DNA-binding GntR family transcriptional regulator